jgi:hypothetical protein
MSCSSSCCASSSSACSVVWPSQYQAVPDLDSETLVSAFESLVLENEGWERDKAIRNPAGPVSKRHSRAGPG